ncbi:SPOR domain-containing protein [Azonexus sp.]|uniref:SPOR domain-containing protein n=1 Tax=Azonexus sp. TaxID=1872668 RepID=UPI0039E6D945
MSRDMKPRKTAPQKKSGGGTLVGMFIGLVLGVCIAAGVVWYINKAPLPFNPSVQNNETRNGLPPAGEAPKSLPGKPGDPAPEKRFQFYDILPGKADAVPDKPGSTASAEKPAKTTEQKESKESRSPLFLQAGSFSTAQDADNQKAKLALMGFESNVQQVMIEERTWFRVRIGPYFQLDALNQTRASLAKSGIETQLAK